MEEKKDRVYTIIETDYDYFKLLCSFLTKEEVVLCLERINSLELEYNSVIEDYEKRKSLRFKELGSNKTIIEIFGEDYKDRGKFPSGGNVEKLYPEIWKQRCEADIFNKELSDKHSKYQADIRKIVLEESELWRNEIKEKYPFLYSIIGLNRIYPKNYSIYESLLADLNNLK